ncbi:hypothetical protein LSH36_1097g00005 [Paralvinella palmiformis]|uniref:Uncharacterized protein n=1 Tax=Paralvinella palmiformis TaxID=53620 RepID=A0AAD9IVM3_9ANNE|nr:hypothetical protein LSH36_1097g00005 [Paralvinella palmiformis]
MIWVCRVPRLSNSTLGCRPLGIRHSLYESARHTSIMCSTNNWPLLLDLTKEESKRVLRNLELEAYASIVSAFRAQGDLNKQKKKLLQEIQHVLSISTERHRAEIRRAVNDEKLATVADCIAGPDISSEWHIEGRRLVPIMPRLVPQTAFTMTADNIANQQAVKNLSMPAPAATGNKDRSLTPKASINMTTPPSGRTIRAASPAASGSNVLVLPSGMSIHIKEDGLVSSEKEASMKQVQYVTSADNQTGTRPAASSISTMARVPVPTVSRVPVPVASRVPIPAVVPQTASPQTASAVKISVAKSPIRHHSVTTTASGQKVIIVSSTMSGSTTGTISSVTQAGSSYIQRAVSAIPVVKSSMSTPVTTTVNTVMYSKSSVMPATASVSTVELPVGRTNVITVSSTPSVSGGSAISLTPVYQQSLSTVGGVTPRPRVRTITARPRAPYHSGRATAHTINVPQAMTPSSQSVHIRPSSTISTKPTIHIKQEGSMKIITQGSPSTAGRILPKPTGSQLLVVTTSASSITMVAKTATAGSGTATATHIQGGKVLNISASGSRILATSSPRTSGAGVVTVNPKTLQLTTVKGPNTASRLTNPVTGTKPNVIVVQKAQPKKSIGTPTTPTVQVARTVSSLGSPFEKELVSFLQRQGPVSKDSLQQRSILDRRTGRTTIGDGQPRRHVVVRQKSLDGSQVRRVTLPSGSKSSILAGLMQAVGLSAENLTTIENNAVSLEDSRAVASITPNEENKDSTTSGQSNRWLEHGVQGSQDSTIKVITSGSVDSSAIKALLDLQAGSSHGIKVQGPRGLSTLQLSSLQGEEIMLEPMPSEDRPQSPDLQIVDTSGLDDTPTTHARVVQHRTTVKQIQKVHVLDEAGNSVQVQIANPEELNQLTNVPGSSSPQQIVGEIDPRTGFLHTSTGAEPPPSSMQMGEEVTIQVISSEDHEAEKAAMLNKTGVTKTIILSTSGEKPVTTVPLQTTSSISDPDGVAMNNCTPATSAEKLDFLSSALNQAQIDLDSYHYVDEDSEKSQQVVTSGDGVEQQPVTLVSILNRPSGASMSESNVMLESPVEQSEQATQIQLLSHQDNVQDLQGNLPASTPVAIGNRLVAKLTTNHSRPALVSRPRTHLIPIKDVDKRTTSTIHIIKSGSYSSGSVDQLATVPVSANVSITAEKSQFDASNMNIDELSSQQNMDSDLSSEDILVTSNCSDNQLDPGASVRLSKRKRKPPPAADEIHSPTQANWTKTAASVLQKVMRVRGAYKEKGEMNAASWFTQPVDAREVPDYYEIIENPMDFATIKRKLEASQYSDLEEFHADMLLVRDNCHRYNPPGTDVRRDCDEVFSFYVQEYERNLQNCHHVSITNSCASSVSSPTGKRLRLEPGTVCP